jgi:2-dehydropantoate 2-reductase
LQTFEKIYVLGAGAVGCYFGGMLARAHHDVTLIARPARTQAIKDHGLKMDCQSFQEVIKLKASSQLTLLKDADLILLSVKSLDTKKTIQEIAPILPKRAVILSLQNGVANVDIASSLMTNPIFPAVVYVASGMMDERTMKHHGRGELYIGKLAERSTQDEHHLAAIATLFEASAVPCSIAPYIKRDMWLKFLVNCTFNAISGIGQISYGEMVKVPEIIKLIDGITKEFIAIAALEGINIDIEEAGRANELIANTMATQVSSTAQDLVKKNRTEIDFLNGYIVELGKRHGVSTPFNQAVYALVKMLEPS